MPNNHSRIKDIRKYKILDPVVSKQTRKAKEKYSLNKECNKFANQHDHMPKEFDIRKKQKQLRQ